MLGKPRTEIVSVNSVARTLDLYTFRMARIVSTFNLPIPYPLEVFAPKYERLLVFRAKNLDQGKEYTTCQDNEQAQK